MMLKGRGSTLLVDDIPRDSDHLAEVLRAAAGDRPAQAGRVVLDPLTGRQELAWVVRERQAMCDAVNSMRAARGRRPVPLEDVHRAESVAQGHIDYALKYAIGCAELVAG